jgi:autoinducer 2-degrading protein
MLAMLVKVRIKPEKRDRFLEVIEHDALASERDEPGCLRFNVLQDAQDPNTYIFYEVYKDQAALEAHRATPHFAMWNEASQECLAAPAERTPTQAVFPSDPAYWAKR